MARSYATISGMDSYQISKARNRFSHLVGCVQESGLPVEITLHGKPAVYILPVCQLTDEAVDLLRHHSYSYGIAEARDNLPRIVNRVVDSLDMRAEYVSIFRQKEMVAYIVPVCKIASEVVDKLFEGYEPLSETLQRSAEQ